MHGSRRLSTPETPSRHRGIAQLVELVLCAVSLVLGALLVLRALL
jgi:hypothetical protein